MTKERFQTRLPNNTAEQVEEFMAENELSEAEAVRQLLEAGLQVKVLEEQYTEAHASEKIMSLSKYVIGGVIGLLAGGYLPL